MKSNLLFTVLLVPCALLLSSSLISSEKDSLTIYKSNNNDLSVLSGFSSFNFFFLAGGSSTEESKKLNNLANTSLGKYGMVVSRSLDVQNPTEGINNPNSPLKSPSLIFNIEPVRDLQGKLLPISVASLEFDGGVTIGKTKAYTQACLWSRKCYVQGDLGKNLATSVSKTLDFLLKEFNKDFQEVNKDAASKITFYFLQP
jgi:hypothetical protein